MMYHNLWCAAKELVRGKCIAFDAYVRKEMKFQINNLSFYFKKKRTKLNPKWEEREYKDKSRNQWNKNKIMEKNQ